MQPHNRKKLSDRVIKAAEVALAARKYVSPVDVLVGIGWLDPGAVKRWQQGQFDHLEGAVQTNLPRISEAMKLFRSWATAKGLIPSETHYVAQTPSRRTLRFSKSGNPTIEKLYRTHWISGDLSENEQEHLACLRCAGLDDLEYLPAGDALLTRRAKAKSPRYAVVVRFSRSRHRYERQGLLVEPRALAEAQRELDECPPHRRVARRV
jgi:hypothetical protein